MWDISHISGLVVSGVHTSPVPFCDVIMTTTHKTLRWPRWAMIMVTQRWVEKDPDLVKKIDMSVFPGLQGWPHNHQTLAIAVALWEALTPEFREMNTQIVKNAKVLASYLKDYWFDIATGWTDNHLVLAGVGKWRGGFMQDALDAAWMALNKNTIPWEPCSPFNPSWIRMWTPVLTQRWMKEDEVRFIALKMKEVSNIIAHFEYKDIKEERIALKKEFREFIANSAELKNIKAEIKELCNRFSIYK